jgi:hypothetical protein
LQTTRAGSQAMHSLRVRVLDGSRDCGVESVSNRQQMSQWVLSRTAAILLLA